MSSLPNNVPSMLVYYAQGLVAGLRMAVGEAETLIELQPDSFAYLHRLNLKLHKMIDQNLLTEIYPQYNFLQYLKVRAIMRPDLSNILASIPVKSRKKKKRKR